MHNIGWLDLPSITHMVGGKGVRLNIPNCAVSATHKNLVLLNLPEYMQPEKYKYIMVEVIDRHSSGQ